MLTFYMTSYGMSPDEAKTVLDKAIKDELFKALGAGFLDRHVDGYPVGISNSMKHEIRDAARKWLEVNHVKAWYLPAFMPEFDGLKGDKLKKAIKEFNDCRGVPDESR